MLVMAAAARPVAAAAQAELPPAFVNSEVENYLRVLQVAGKTEPYPWSVRDFSPREVEHLLPADSAHPWAERYRFERDTAAGVRARWILPRSGLILNTTFPYGRNDGAVWAGRGVTAVVEGGVEARYGPLSLTLDPVAFVAGNAGFPLAPTGVAGEPFADPEYPGAIDLPQRFGDGPYARVDPGQSTLRLDVGPLALGASTANQHWGPAVENPLLLGNNAAGYPHVFLGTAHPVDLWIGRVQGRLVWGSLGESRWATPNSLSDRRFMSGVVAVFTPRGIDGLEVGGGRFFHLPWRPGGPSWSDISKPWEALLKNALGSRFGGDGSNPDNQLASVFFRWVAPHAGLEVYGEYGKEDHNRDWRHLFLELDHDRAYVLGFRKVWEGGDGRLTALRGELLNSQQGNLEHVLPQTRWYTHSVLTQGHTELGQALGSGLAYGGGGEVLAVDRYTRRGRVTVSWTRELLGESGVTFGSPSGGERDVIHSLGVDGVLFRSRVDLTGGVRAMVDLNRNFGHDSFNLNATFGVRLAR